MSTLEELDLAIAEELKRGVELKTKQFELLKEHKLRYFIPQPKQMGFFENADKKRRVGLCGNRFGKSTMGTAEDCSWLMGERPFFPKGHPLRRKGIPERGVKILLIGADWDKLNEIFTSQELVAEEKGKIFEYLPSNNIVDVEKTQSGNVCKIVVENVLDGIRRRSSIYFDTVKSFQLNGLSQESSDWDAIHVDEPIPQAMWTAVSRGLVDRFGSAWWLLTPLAFPWMSKEAKKGVKEDSKNWYLFGGSMGDNALNTKESMSLFLNTLKDDERQAREMGIPLTSGRLVYPYFNEEKHVAKSLPHGWSNFNTPPPDYTKAYALDPHPQTPHAVLFVAISPFGVIHIYDEIFEKTSIVDLARKINERRYIAGGFTYELCDPIAWIENPDTGRRWIDTLSMEGLNLQKASKAKTHGIILANGLFQPGTTRRIQVHPNCTNFIREIEGYYYTKENVPVDADDHMMENFYRLNFHNDFKYIPQTEFLSPYKPKDEVRDPYDIPNIS